MRRTGSIAVTFGLALALAALSAHAQCPLSEFTIAGRVVDGEGRPIPDARVVATWNERAAGQVSNQRDTDAEGAFSIRVPFDTFSGRTFLGEARCEAVLERVTLTVTSPGHRARTETVIPGETPPSIPIVLEPE
jgi:hypothetical protein